jgi:hypothetical protein
LPGERACGLGGHGVSVCVIVMPCCCFVSRQQRVHPGIISASYSQVTGPKLAGGGYQDVNTIFFNIGADQPINMVVHAYDKFNNTIVSGGEAGLMYMQVLLQRLATSRAWKLQKGLVRALRALCFPRFTGCYAGWQATLTHGHCRQRRRDLWCPVRPPTYGHLRADTFYPRFPCPPGHWQRFYCVWHNLPGRRSNPLGTF